MTGWGDPASLPPPWIAQESSFVNYGFHKLSRWRMLHTLMVQLADSGGEIVLALMFAVSVTSVAIISNRIWYLYSQRPQTERLAAQLLAAICASDWAKAWTIAQRSKLSLALVVAAGLTQLERGRQAVRSAILSARVRERTRLEGPLVMLQSLGQSALLLGLLGTLLDLVRLAQESGAAPAASVKTVNPYAAMDALGPAAAGLIVAIPALLAAGFLKYRVQLALRQIDTLAHLLLLQVDEPQRPAASEPAPPAAKAA